MKVKFFGGSTFDVTGAEKKIMFNAVSDLESYDVALSSNNSGDVAGAKKTFGLPGEFEISDILLRGFRTEKGASTIFKVFLKDTSIVHLGNLTEIPETGTLKELGENIDVAIVILSESFTAKKAKELIDTIEPRMVLVGGDETHFPALKALMPVEIITENTIEVDRSKLSDEATEVKILTA
ncbi:hypothetical protein CSB37_02840 [bacterium DOLZORAL124_38_8]|nr:MAG: hypothetical protein CSB37_02840 [bacterium DOLZORAL124_38_8]